MGQLGEAVSVRKIKFGLKTMAAGLVPLLLLTHLSGGTEKDKADWSRVRAVSPESKTEVLLSEDKISLDQETHGRFHSATDNSLTLRFEDGQLNTFQKPDIERVLTYRPMSERWAGWATLAVSSIIMAILLRGDTEGAPLVLLPFVAGPTAIAFYGSASMKEVYRVPPNHGDWYPPATSKVTGDPSDGQGAPLPANNPNEAGTKSK